MTIVTLLSDTISKFRPKTVWISPEQMRELKTNVTLQDWISLEILGDGKYGIRYCGAEVLVKPFIEEDRHEEIDLTSGKAIVMGAK